jgi:general transcription factor IIIA
MKIHELRDRESALAIEADDEDEDDISSCEEDRAMESRPAKKRRRGGELGRDFVCEVEDCGKDFKSVSGPTPFSNTLLMTSLSQKQALATHNTITHLGRRDFYCDFPGCGKTYGYKRLLVRHMAKHRRLNSPNANIDGHDPAGSGDDKSGEEQGAIFNIANLTGEAYASRPTSFVRCPYPNFRGLTRHLPEHYHSPMKARDHENCDYTFRRTYDLRRHLRAIHDLELEKDVIDRWADRIRLNQA